MLLNAFPGAMKSERRGAFEGGDEVPKKDKHRGAGVPAGPQNQLGFGLLSGLVAAWTVRSTFRSD